MKLILSRKGFDSSAGGVASPILEDGRLASLPIPDRSSPVDFADLRVAGEPCAPWVETLTRGRVRSRSGAHLDPDLDRRSVARTRGWRALFGQSGAAQAHLQRRGVGPGDLFLFFGWFRRTEGSAAALRYRPGAPDLHVLFGWLQVDRVWRVDAETGSTLPWARGHPHLHGARGPANTLYQARRSLRLPGGRHVPRAGAGAFPGFDPRLQLSGDPEGRRRSLWTLPAWFHPAGRASVLSYHEDPRRWERRRGRVLLRSASRGQEFVLDCDHYPEALPWLRSILVAR